jgi:hypothetical protein
MTAGRTAILAGALAGSSFALCYGLATAFGRTGVFEYVDVLFDTDVAWFLQGFSDGMGTGTGWGARSVVHPNVANLVNPPVRALAAACASVNACADPALTRQTLALFVSPAAAAIETLFLFLGIRTIFQSDGRALVVAMLNLTLLPTLIYGALPESFALSGCAFAAFFYLVCRTAAGRSVHQLWWALAGTAVASITVTNVWLFALGYTVAHARDRWLTVNALLSAARVAGTALAVTAVLALVVGATYDALPQYGTPLQQLRELRAPRERLAERRWHAAISETAGLALSGAFFYVPKSLGDTILPPRPLIYGRALGLDTTRGTIGARAEPSLQIGFREASPDWGTLLALAALAGAAALAVTAHGPQRLVYRVALMLLAGNWAFHSVFGAELFLYAKHWSVAVAILLCSWLDVKRPGAHVGVAILLVLTALAAWRVSRVFAVVFQALAGS